MYATMIDEYTAGSGVVKQAIVGLTESDLDALPVPETWSIRQIVLHLLDSDLVMADRMKRVIAEENPPLAAFDETLFARRLGYDQSDAALAAEMFELNRRHMAAVLRRLKPADFAREGNHSERGPVSLANLVAGAVGHLEHHLRFLHEKRRLIGKALRGG